MSDDLRRIFAKISNDAGDRYIVPISTVRVSKRLHSLYTHLYRDTRNMIDRHEDVLNDGEHRTVIEEGRRLGLRMPDTESFRNKIAALRAQLESYDPWNVHPDRDEKKVQIPVATARDLHITALMATDFIHDYLRAVQSSDYMRWTVMLKERGIPYAGPTSLAEVFTAYLTLRFVAAQAEEEGVSRSLPQNWTKGKYYLFPSETNEPGRLISMRGILPLDRS